MSDYHEHSKCIGINSHLGCGNNNIVESDNSWAAGTGCRIHIQDDCTLTFGCGEALFHSVGSNTVALKCFGSLNLNRYHPVPNMPLGGNLIEQKQIGSLLHLQDQGPGEKHYISTISYTRKNENGDPEATGSWSYIPQRPSDWKKITIDGRVDKTYFPYSMAPGNVNLGLDLLANHLSHLRVYNNETTVMSTNQFQKIIPIQAKVLWNCNDLPKSFNISLYDFQPKQICCLQLGLVTWQNKMDQRMVVRIEDGLWLTPGNMGVSTTQCLKIPSATSMPAVLHEHSEVLEFEYSDSSLSLKYQTENANILNELLLEGFLEVYIIQFK